MEDLKELIGKKCSHIWNSDLNIINDSNTIECEILGFNIEINEKIPFDLIIKVLLEPTKPINKQWQKENKGCIDAEIMCLSINGRDIKSLCFDI